MAYEKKDDIPLVVAVPSPVDAESNPLRTMKGALIRQDTQPLECFLQYIGLYCLELDNVYRYAPLPQNKSALRKLSNDPGWRPRQTEIDNIPQPFVNKERSDMLVKCLMVCLGCASCRPFHMDFSNSSELGPSYMHIDRKCALGGFWCCPHNAEVSVGGQLVGRVVEDWNCNNPFMYFVRCFEYFFMCRVPYDLQLVQNGQYANRYRINVNTCACGPHCNFCGSTIFCNDMLFDVAPYTSSGAVDIHNPAGRIQKTYGGSCSPQACLRWYCCTADNFIVEWDDATTVEERALFVTATTLLDYVFFENKDKRRRNHWRCLCDILDS